MSEEPALMSDRDVLSRDELMSALLANMVVQQTNMALVFLGKVPHPETGQPVQDLDAAQMFIDQLEMLAFKTRGNLTKEEEHLLQQSLMTLRMAFVEAVEKPLDKKDVPTKSDKSSAPKSSASASATSQQAAAPNPIISGESAGNDAQKRFTKKY